MDVTARLATPHDLDEIERLYRLLEAEMAGLSYLWTAADGVGPEIREAFERMLAEPASWVLVSTIDEIPFGFMYGRIEDLPDGSQVGAIRLVFTQEEARGVGIGSSLRERMIELFEDHGVDRLDAHVLPGHRLAKNFFEAGGFSARHIIMHRQP